MISDFLRWLTENPDKEVMIDLEPGAPMPRPARQLDGEDVASFMRASESRPLTPRRPSRGATDFYSWLGRNHRFRAKALRKDLRWYVEEASRYGLSPEEVIAHLLER